MKFPSFITAERVVGRAETRRYDLPLNNGPGSGFLTLLIGLMAFLAALTLAAFFGLSGMTDRWSSGLENKATVEVPARTAEGTLLAPEAVDELTARVDVALKAQPGIKSTKRLSEDDIRALIQPWLGDSDLPGKVPLPGLISLDLSSSDPEIIGALEKVVTDNAPGARIDRHESWLHDLLRFTGGLRTAAFLLSLAIGCTAAAAVAGAVQARMAIHSADVELLHLIGASDSYIAGQFQRHFLILALKGAAAGTLAGGLALLGTAWIMGGGSESGLLPGLALTPPQMAAILFLPLAAGLLATVAARQTALRTLSRML